jgi:hypothetical protein
MLLLLLLLFIPLSLRTEHRDSTVPRHPRLLFQFLGSVRHLVGLLGGGISPAQDLYLHRTTQHRKTQTNIHASSRIRTCDPNIRAAEDSTYLRPVVFNLFSSRTPRDTFPLNFVPPKLLVRNSSYT